MSSVYGFAAISAAVAALLVSKKKLWASSKHRGDEKQCPDVLLEGDRKFIKWDFNWDKMAPVDSTQAIDDGSEGQVEPKPTASRTLILIRHGQYVWDPHNPNKRILTELGRKQAAITGQRLKDLGYAYSTIHYSTMPRATETSHIIQKSLSDVPVCSCDLMREGAPIRPEPMHKKWRPESYVSMLVWRAVMQSLIYAPTTLGEEGEGLY